MFNIPKELHSLDKFVLTQKEIDHFIWSNNLVIVKDQMQEEIGIEDESTESIESDSCNSSPAKVESSKKREIREVIFKIPVDWYRNNEDEEDE